MWNLIKFPIIIAHRGSSNFAPENTLAAFELAASQGAEAIELDAKLTSDGHVVVIHDQTLERTTNGNGKVIETSLSEFKALDAGSSFEARFAGEQIPTLDEVFETVGDKLLINVELTNYSSLFDALPEKVASSVRKHNLTQKVFFSSFSPIALSRIKKLLPECSAGLLTGTGFFGRVSRLIFGNFGNIQAIHPYFKDATKSLIYNAQMKNRLVFPYTVNDADIMNDLFKLGVNGIITDDPPLAIEIRKKI